MPNTALLLRSGMASCMHVYLPPGASACVTSFLPPCWLRARYLCPGMPALTHGVPAVPAARDRSTCQVLFKVRRYASRATCLSCSALLSSLAARRPAHADAVRVHPTSHVWLRSRGQQPACPQHALPRHKAFHATIPDANAASASSAATLHTASLASSLVHRCVCAPPPPDTAQAGSGVRVSAAAAASASADLAPGQLLCSMLAH